jgi:hypothetical protein
LPEGTAEHNHGCPSRVGKEAESRGLRCQWM